MTYKSTLLIAWLTFSGIIIGELLVDYIIRINSDDFYHSGIPEQLWFLIQLLAAGIGCYFIYKSAKLLKSRVGVFMHYAINISLGVLFYGITVLFYIVGLGIDSL